MKHLPSIPMHSHLQNQFADALVQAQEEINVLSQHLTGLPDATSQDIRIALQYAKAAQSISLQCRYEINPPRVSRLAKARRDKNPFLRRSEQGIEQIGAMWDFYGPIKDLEREPSFHFEAFRAHRITIGVITALSPAINTAHVNYFCGHLRRGPMSQLCFSAKITIGNKEELERGKKTNAISQLPLIGVQYIGGQFSSFLHPKLPSNR